MSGKRAAPFRLAHLLAASTWQTYENACKRYATRACLGTLFIPDDGDESKRQFRFISYQQFYADVVAFASGLHALLPPRTAVGICGGNRSEWLIADWACVRQALVFIVSATLQPVDDCVWCAGQCAPSSKVKFVVSRAHCFRNENALRHLR